MLRLFRKIWFSARESTLGRILRTSLAIVAGQRPAFVLSELRADGLEHSWQLREGRRAVIVRSGGRDRDILREIFVDGTYEPPAAAAGALAGVASPSVVDLGGNIGLFGAWALARWPSATIHSFEPDPTNLALLDANISAAGARAWSVTRACAAPADGTLRFLVGHAADSRAVYLEGDSGAGVELPTVDVFRVLDGVDLLKIDIEGGEWPLLSDPRLADAGVRMIVLEYHPYNCPGPGSGPGEPGRLAQDLLRRAGFAVVQIEEHGGGVGTIWALRGR